MKNTTNTVLLAAATGIGVFAAGSEALAQVEMRTTVDVQGALVVDYTVNTNRPMAYHTFTISTRRTATFVCADPNAVPLRPLRYWRTVGPSGIQTAKESQADGAGTVRDSIMFSPPSPPTDLQCPTGYTPQLQSVSYSVIRLQNPNASGSGPNADRVFIEPRP